MVSENTVGTLPKIGSYSSTEHLLKKIENACFTPIVFAKSLGVFDTISLIWRHTAATMQRSVITIVEYARSSIEDTINY